MVVIMVPNVRYMIRALGESGRISHSVPKIANLGGFSLGKPLRMDYIWCWHAYRCPDAAACPDETFAPEPFSKAAPFSLPAPAPASPDFRPVPRPAVGGYGPDTFMFAAPSPSTLAGPRRSAPLTPLPSDMYRPGAALEKRATHLARLHFFIFSYRLRDHLLLPSICMPTASAMASRAVERHRPFRQSP